MRVWRMSLRRRESTIISWDGTIINVSNNTVLLKDLLEDVSSVEVMIAVLEQIEPPHDKTNKTICASSEDLDQPEHPLSLIRAFAVR